MDKWSKAEKKIARDAFDKAYQKCCEEIIKEIQSFSFDSQDEIWELCNRLNQYRKEVRNIFDYRYSQFFFIFPIMIHKGWITLEDLEGLKEDKMSHFKRATSL